MKRTVHTAEHLASAMFYLGRAAGRDSAGEAVRRLQRTHARGAHAVRGASIRWLQSPDKTWPADRFLRGRRASAEALRSEPFSSAARATTCRRFARTARLPDAPLGEIKSLLAGASLFVGNDSGPAHMAAAFGVPVVVLFGTSDPVDLGAVAHHGGSADGARMALRRSTCGKCSTRSTACGCAHEGPAAPAALRPPLLVLPDRFRWC